MEGPVKKKGGFPFRKKVVEETPEARAEREAREAAARVEAEEAARLEEERAARLAEIGAAWAKVGERIRAAIPSSVDYRQAYFLSLLRQGREAQEQERAGLADHCRACIERGLSTLAPARSPATPSAASGNTSAATPLAALKIRWTAAARQRAASLLERHGKRLSPAEREAHGAALEGDAQLLRRKLVDRLLRGEAYRRRGARLSGWKKTAVPEAGPAGPYNDFIALEQTVQRIAEIHPEWAAEFLDLYGEMGKIRTAYQGLMPPGKK